jgi:hypothetical protein
MRIRQSVETKGHFADAIFLSNGPLFAGYLVDLEIYPLAMVYKAAGSSGL